MIEPVINTEITKGFNTTESNRCFIELSGYSVIFIHNYLELCSLYSGRVIIKHNGLGYGFVVDLSVRTILLEPSDDLR